MNVCSLMEHFEICPSSLVNFSVLGPASASLSENQCHLVAAVSLFVDLARICIAERSPRLFVSPHRSNITCEDSEACE